MLLSNDYCMDFWNVFEFNVADMEGIYTKRQVIIPLTLVKMERVQILIRDELYAGRKLYSEISEAFFRT